MPKLRAKEIKDRELSHLQEEKRAFLKTLSSIQAFVDSTHNESLETRRAIQELTKKYAKLQHSITRSLTFLFQLLDDPDAKAHAKAITLDHKFNANKIEKFGDI